MEKLISAYLVKLRRESPFLATLSLYIDYRFTDAVEKFDTDGRIARINRTYYDKLDTGEQMGMLLHVTLHAALLHPVRRGHRIPQVWNIAADIVVNAIIDDTSFKVPPGTAVEPRYADLSVEQVYVKLMSSAHKMDSAGSDPDGDEQDAEAEEVAGASAAGSSTADPAGDDQQDANSGSAGDGQSAGQDNSAGASAQQQQAAAGSNAGCEQDSAGRRSGVGQKQSSAGQGSKQQIPQSGVEALQTVYGATADLAERKLDAEGNDDGDRQPDGKTRDKQLEGYWKEAMTRAQTADQLSSGKVQGDLPAGLAREIEQVLNPQIDWRVLLWRFMARTPCDFSGFDRRFVHQGLYLDYLEAESLSVRIAMDTSGSVEDHELAQFRAEVESIVRCYSHIDAQLYFVDADVYGPYPLSANKGVVAAEGGGGTDFAPFFDGLETDPFSQTVAIYLTDGYGNFPEQPPPMPVLWVVTQDGHDEYPFGEVARLAY